jgi:hypothetical protein
MSFLQNRKYHYLNTGKYLILAIYCGVFMGFSGLAAAPQAYAQIEYNVTPQKRNSLNIDISERVGFAYYTLSGSRPPIDKWVKSSDAYLAASADDRPLIYNNEVNRLKNAFNQYMISDDLIVIRTPVVIDIPQERERRALFSNSASMPVKFKPSYMVNDSFLIEIAGNWIAVISENLEEHINLELAPDEAKHFIKSTRLHDSINTNRLYIEFALRPKSIHPDRPITLNTVLAHPMITEIVSTRLWDNAKSTKNEEHLWENNFLNPDNNHQRELLQLYSK